MPWSLWDTYLSRQGQLPSEAGHPGLSDWLWSRQAPCVWEG